MGSPETPVRVGLFTAARRHFQRWCDDSSDKVRLAKQQLGLTFGGTGLICSSLVLAALVALITLGSTYVLLNEIAEEYRDQLLHEVIDFLGAGLAPLHQSVHRLSQLADVGQKRGNSTWPPLLPAYTGGQAPGHVDKLAAVLYSEWHDAPSSSALLISAVLALQGNLASTATSFEDCAAVGVIELIPSLANHSPNDALNAMIGHQRVVERPDGNETLVRDVYAYDPATASATLVSSDAVSLQQCEVAMEPIWGVEMQSAFGNWTWHLSSSNTSANRQLQGSKPIYSSDGAHVIGRITVSSMYLDGIQIALGQVMDGFMDLTRGGQLMVHSTEGQVLALSGESGVYDRFELIDVVMAETGSRCPDEKVKINHEDSLIDSAPFAPEDYGIPPFGAGRWCVLAQLPRNNIYEAIDAAVARIAISGAGVTVTTLAAIGILACATVLGASTMRGLVQQKLTSDRDDVHACMRDSKSLGCPMSLISAANFLKLQRLQHHESVRDEGKLVVLDNVEEINKFQEGHLIVFISHQWLRRTFPDVDGGDQLRAMQGAARVVQKEGQKDVYLWLDYISIAQENSKMLIAAVESLPVYASVADVFVIIAPTVPHGDFGFECNLATYMTRGWCRAEMLSKACGSGLENMYACTDTVGTLTPVDEIDKFSMNVSMNVFEGEFTVTTDKENLVQPVLGLYSLVLEQESPHMQLIYEHIQEEKHAFFPCKCVNPDGVEVELFGQRVELLEEVKRESRGRKRPKPQHRGCWRSGAGGLRGSWWQSLRLGPRCEQELPASKAPHKSDGSADRIGLLQELPASKTPHKSDGSADRIGSLQDSVTTFGKISL